MIYRNTEFIEKIARKKVKSIKLLRLHVLQINNVQLNYSLMDFNDIDNRLNLFSPQNFQVKT